MIILGQYNFSFLIVVLKSNYKIGWECGILSKWVLFQILLKHPFKKFLPTPWPSVSHYLTGSIGMGSFHLTIGQSVEAYFCSFMVIINNSSNTCGQYPHLVFQVRCRSFSTSQKSKDSTRFLFFFFRKITMDFTL